MMRALFDRMIRPRDLLLRFHRASAENHPGVSGFLVTDQQLRSGELDRIRQLDTNKLVDGERVKIERSR